MSQMSTFVINPMTTIDTDTTRKVWITLICGLIYKILMVLDYSRLFCFNINMEYQGKAFSLVVSDTTLNMVEISLYFTQTQESWRFGICHKYEPNVVFIISICQVGRYLYKTESVQVLELFLGICWRINWLIPPPPPLPGMLRVVYIQIQNFVIA